MRVDEVRQRMAAYDGVLVLAPEKGDGTPEIAWGDLFFYYAPDGEVPAGQPFATVTTKDYPDEPSWSTGPGSWRVNIGVGATTFETLLGYRPRDSPPCAPDVVPPDTVVANPSYAALAWVSVVDPGERTSRVVLEQLDAAYDAAQRRAQRRDNVGGDS